MSSESVIDLRKAHEELFASSEDLIGEVASLLSRVKEVGIRTEDCKLEELLTQIREPFSIFVAGEFNSGKSSLINRLAGEEVSPIGILPTTSEILRLQLARVAGLVFIDSPGTNSIIKEHQNKTEKFLSRTDIVLFVTSAERPLTESEITFLRLVSKTWKRNLVVVLNKTDLVQANEIEQLVNYVRQGIKHILDISPPFFTVSARSGQGVGELSTYLFEVLSQTEKTRLKITAPLQSLQVQMATVYERLEVFKSSLLSEKKVFEKVIARVKERVSEAPPYFESINDSSLRLFEDLSQQLLKLIDEHFSFFQVLKAKISGNQGALRSHVYAALVDLNFEERIKTLVLEAARRLVSYRQSIYTDVKHFIDLVAREEQFQAVELSRLEPPFVDVSQISAELRESVESGINKFLAFGGVAAASGLGAKVATVSSFEITGAILMTTLAVFSLRAIPYERKKAKNKIKKSFAEMGNSFTQSLSDGVEGKLQSTLAEIEDKLSPDLTRINENLARIDYFQNSLTRLSDTAKKLASRADIL